MSNITTTLTLSPQVQQSWAHRLLSVRVPNMIHKLPADLYRMPRNGGKTLRMRRYNPLQVAVSPLGPSGVTPPPQQLTAVDIDTTMQFYGTYVVLNEQVTLQNQEDKKNVLSKFPLIDLEAYSESHGDKGQVLELGFSF